MQVLVHNTSGAGGMPRTGLELNRGTEGVIYENLDDPGMVVKEFHKGRGSPVQAQNEFENLEKARAIPGRADNVVKARAPVDPRQDFLVKERVLPTDVPEDLAQKIQVIQDFKNIQDSSGNLLWGTTADNPTPRWMLIE
jgi:hypothetical protein